MSGRAPSRGPQRFGHPNRARIFLYRPAIPSPPPAGTVYNDTLTEASAAADALATSATFPNDLAEAGSAGDALTLAAVFPNAVAESIAAADSIASTASFAGAVAEAGGAVDTLDTTATFPNALGESGTAADNVSGGLLTSDTVTESGAAADALSVVQAFAATLSEALAATDDLVASGIWPNDLAEPGASADAVDATASMPAALSEPAAAADLVDSPLPQTYDEALTEAAFAFDSYDAGPLPVVAPSPEDQPFGGLIIVSRLGPKPATYDERLTEALQADDAASSLVGFLEALQERGNAVDALGARAEWRATIGEALAPGVDVVGSTAIGLAISEPATALDGLELRGFYNPSDEMLAMMVLFGDDLVEKRGIAPLDREREKVVNAREAIRRSVGEFFAHLSLHLATVARGIRKAEEEDPVVRAVQNADFQAVNDATEPQLREVAKDAAALGLDQVGAEVHVLLTQANERAVAWAHDRAAELVTQVEETTRDGVRALVARALDEGWSNDELADALLESGVFSASRAETIARTETAAADVAGNLIGWKESGLVSGKEWKTGGGPCDLCDELDGEVAPLDGEFPDGDPPLHPNCRCDVLPVLAEDSEE